MTDTNTCIAIRLRRTIHQDAYLRVPLTEALRKKTPEEDGSYPLDTDALFAEATRMGELSAIEWQVEESSAAVHPLQRAAPEGRVTYDIHEQHR